MSAENKITSLLPSISVVDVVRHRNEIVDKLNQAAGIFGEAVAIGKSMEVYGLDASLSLSVSSYSHRLGWFGDKELTEQLTKDVDRRIWQTLVERSGIKTFMDAEARTAFHKDLMDRAPPITVENVTATFASLHDRRAEMFERGVVNLFRRRSWDFKTNSPVAFGNKMILRSGCETRWGGRWGLGIMAGTGDALDDILRVLAVLAGHPEPDHRQGSAAQIVAQPWGPNDPVAVIGVPGCTPALPMFEVKGFRNGNIHIRFCQPQLIQKLNRIVAKHHPNMLPPSEKEVTNG